MKRNTRFLYLISIILLALSPSFAWSQGKVSGPKKQTPAKKENRTQKERSKKSQQTQSESSPTDMGQDSTVYKGVQTISESDSKSVSAEGQFKTTLPSRVNVYLPAQLSQNIVKECDVIQLVKSGNWGQNKRPNNPKHWVVYSDRDNNVTYHKPSSSATAIDKLKFNEKVRIANIKNGYALVYTEPKEGELYPDISGTAKSRGWIPMENLLLWQSCPANDRGIYPKGLLVTNFDEAEQSKVDLGIRYSNPQSKSQIGNIKPDMTSYFVMKKDPKSGLVLLAKQAKMDGASDQILYGWVNEDLITLWNERICLEPNWDPDDVSFFNNHSNNYHFYSDASLLNPIATYRYGEKNYEDKNPTSWFRMDPWKLRFPLLPNNELNNNIYKCVTFIDQFEPDLGIAIGLENKIKLSENVNLIFVVDGTSSMRPYYVSLKNTIQESANYFDKQKFNVKVSVVIYKGYNDGGALVEVQPLVNTTDSKVFKFLDALDNRIYETNPPFRDHHDSRALFKGIETALDAKEIGYSPEHSNLMLVIGDCGNALNDSTALSENQLIKQLVDNNIHLMSYQIRTNSAETRQLFNSQMSTLICQNIVGQYKKRNIEAKVKFKPNRLGYDIDNGKDRQLFIGAIRFGDENQAMDPNVLTYLMKDGIGQFRDAIERQLDILQRATDGNIDGFQAEENDNSQTMDFQFLRSNLNDNLTKAIADRKTLALVAYVPKNYPGSERKLWKEVIYISLAELDDLLDRLFPVYNQANAVKESNYRKPYVEAVKGVLKAMIPDITDAEMDDTGIADVMSMFTGLIASNDVPNYTLGDLQNALIVPKDKYAELIKDFCKKYEGLCKIRKGKYIYAYESNYTKYYWIPVEDLP